MKCGGGNISYMEIQFRVTIKVKQGIFPFKYSCKVTSEYLCNHFKRHKQNSRSAGQPMFKKRRSQGNK